jgi:hypothetical protein
VDPHLERPGLVLRQLHGVGGVRSLPLPLRLRHADSWQVLQALLVLDQRLLVRLYTYVYSTGLMQNTQKTYSFSASTDVTPDVPIIHAG